jgi:hypothetical protein
MPFENSRQRARRIREERLAAMQQAIREGRLTIRQATEEERASWPPRPEPKPNEPVPCEEPGCTKYRMARGLCVTHYARRAKLGTLPPTLKEREAATR